MPISGGAKVRFENIVVGSLLYVVLNSGLTMMGFSTQMMQLIMETYKSTKTINKLEVEQTVNHLQLSNNKIIYSLRAKAFFDVFARNWYMEHL